MLLLGKYESLGVLGRGNMGAVHAARPSNDPATTVVVKVMRRDLADSPRARQFFDREMQYTAKLQHPYIVRVLETGIDADSGPCIVMEFVPGITLEKLLQNERKLHVPRATWLTACLCHALEAAHLSGVIHRDLKPNNLMIVNAGTREEHLKVMDFGLAHLVSKPYLSQERLSGMDVVVAQGTPDYISPEQLRGDDVDGRADLYSTAVILYEMLSGRPPFFGLTPEQAIEAHLRRNAPKLTGLGLGDIPAQLQAVLDRCLGKFPAERPPSARVLAGELGSAVGADLWTNTTPFGEVLADMKVPMAEPVAPEPKSEPNTLVRKAEAWMPDRIAVVKLGGFLEDLGGKVLNTQPGLLQARFVKKAKPTGFFDRFLGKAPEPVHEDGIDLDLSLHKPNPAESRLIVTATFRVTRGGPPRNRSDWNNRALQIFDEMKRYLMVQI